MATDYTTWAESLCDPAAVERPLLQRPHALAGTDLGFTTDGRIALLLSASEWGRELDVHGDVHGWLRQTLDQPSRHTMPLRVIRRWAGKPKQRRCDCDGKPVECEGCNGVGSHECACGYRAHDCGLCDGTGRATCPECSHGLLPPLMRPAPLLVGGPLLDRNLLHKLLHTCPDPTATPVKVGWGGERDPVVLRAAGWTGLVMPTTHRAARDEKPLVPADWNNPLGAVGYDEDAFGRPVYDPPGERSA